MQVAGAELTSLVFPVYNAAGVLERTWGRVAEFLRTAPGRWEAVFVCDGCTDDSAATLDRLSAGTPRVRVLAYPRNRGKGYAVRHGLAAARGRWRLFTDADLAYGPDEILKVARRLWAGAPVAVASRLHPESRLIVPPRFQGHFYRRHLQSQAFAALARWLLPLRLADTQAGLKGLSAEAAGQLLPHLRCRGFGFDCELLTACARFRLPVEEVPVCVRYEDRASTTGLGSAGRMVRELWKIRRRWRRFVVPAVDRAAGPGVAAACVPSLALRAGE